MALDRFSLLMGKGYLPRELPRAFRSTSFGRHARKIFTEWRNAGVVHPDCHKLACVSQTYKNTEPELYSCPRGPLDRRNLSIVHLIAQTVLAYTISSNWRAIKIWADRSEYNLQKVEIFEDGLRAILDPPFDLTRQKQLQILGSHEWILETDVEKFYPSTYTHAIPWAIYGKEAVKEDLGKHNALLGGKLDALMRKCNRNQSVGLPIGPDTSHIIAEILSAAIDQQIKQKSEGFQEAVRLQDDWLIACRSHSEAEQVLSFLSRDYHSFGYNLNLSKTLVTESRTRVNPTWIFEIRDQIKRINIRSKADRYLALFERAIELQGQQPQEPILRYVCSTFVHKSVADDSLNLLFTMLMRAISIDGGCLPDAVQIIANHRTRPGATSTERIVEKFTNLAIRGLEHHSHHEAAWSLYMLRALRVSALPDSIGDGAEVLGGSVVPIILLDMQAKGTVAKLPVASWQKSVSSDILTEPSWLLAYEGVRNGWLTDSGNVIRNSAMLRPLFDRGVWFYNPDLNVETFTAAMRRFREQFARRRLFLTHFLRYEI